ncbi:MAG: TldD/PmbA family protein [Bacteroidota bacterium]|nr:TldD/PmbA family protein [Rhodothermia bacterium]MCS7155819.1 TldD/PmbA family protein [Bacteroidota bacterium]MDW8138208.1 TldD/PmbA family protein [Bacteroidota bacterium]MDW8285892.1 TldD/PmbA family protein [Bacteroidota bacterium]
MNLPWDAEALLQMAHRLRGGGYFADLFLEKTLERWFCLLPDGSCQIKQDGYQGAALRAWTSPLEVRFCALEGTALRELRAAVEAHRLPGSAPLQSDLRIITVKPATSEEPSEDLIQEALASLRALVYDALPQIAHLEATLILNERHKCIVHTEGRLIEEYSRSWTARVEVAQRGPRGLMRALYLNGGIGGPEASWIALPEEALRCLYQDLERQREAQTLRSGSYPVLLGPGWTGMFWHEALGHRVEADVWSAQDGRPRPGARIASSAVTLWDWGTLPGGRGSAAFDDEGTPQQQTLLVAEGELVGLLTDRLWAARLRRSPTGNGRRMNFRHPPLPRMTNTVLAPGPYSADSLLEGLEEGLWVLRLGPGGVLPDSAKIWFEVVEAYWVEHGRVRYPLAPFRLVASSDRLLKGVLAVGNDLHLGAAYGTCLKQGQALPVSAASPSVLIGAIRAIAHNPA